jgi:hypothetical protein
MFCFQKENENKTILIRLRPIISELLPWLFGLKEMLTMVINPFLKK